MPKSMPKIMLSMLLKYRYEIFVIRMLKTSNYARRPDTFASKWMLPYVSHFALHSGSTFGSGVLCAVSYLYLVH